MALFGRIIRAEDGSGQGSPKSPESPEQREICVRDDLLRRLKGVCKDMPEQEFRDLVAAMTREQLRSERLG